MRRIAASVIWLHEVVTGVYNEMRALGLTAALVVIAAFTSARAAESTQAAVWLSHALIVDLRNLPKRYTCDELWYKFRDVLLAIGARPDLKILPYRCDRRSGSSAYSPKVQLEFSLPHVVSGKDERWAQMHVSTKSVRLEPGAPSHLDDSDCALLNQIRGTLLRSIGAPVTEFRLACQAPSASEPAFDLTVKAAVPVIQPSAAVVGVGPTSRGEPAGSGS
jgi:hypothetical protein